MKRTIVQPTLFPLEQCITLEGENSNHWFTPDTTEQPVLTVVKMALGGAIALDPTSDGTGRTGAKRHITERENCLIQQARNETIFCNPPFDDPLPFVEWCALEVEERRSPQAIMLCKAGVLANQGTGKIIKQFATATCHWHHNGRIEFIPGPGVIARLEREYAEGKRRSPTPSTADFDCVFINFGPWEQFATCFDFYGHVQLTKRSLMQLNPIANVA